jgi:hypothetical protein
MSPVLPSPLPCVLGLRTWAAHIGAGYELLSATWAPSWAMLLTWVIFVASILLDLQLLLLFLILGWMLSLQLPS